MIFVLSDISSPRLTFVLEFIFDTMGADFKIITDKKVFTGYSGVKINYTANNIPDVFHIFPTALLFEKKIKTLEPHVQKSDIPYFFAVQEGDFPFDIFSAVFYLVSRYEEYPDNEKDQHNRYLAKNSLAYNNGFLHIPIVDFWIDELKKQLTSTFPEFNPGQKTFQFIPTIDVDVAYYSYSSKGFIRGILSLLKDVFELNFSNIKLQAQILFKQKPDPFDTFDEILKVHQRNTLKTIFFFNIGKYGKFDKNLPAGSKKMAKLLGYLGQHADIGVHPSYASNNNPGLIKEEIDRLSKYTNLAITKSRQHYLKLEIPKTYRNLVDAGIKEDYTMGYSEEPGFRAGTCSPFYFYDLEKEEKTNLKIFPFAIMDGTLNEYRQYSPEESLSVVKTLIHEVKKVNGTFISLWHNSSLSETHNWKGWKWVYERIFN